MTSTRSVKIAFYTLGVVFVLGLAMLIISSVWSIRLSDKTKKMVVHLKAENLVEAQLMAWEQLGYFVSVKFEDGRLLEGEDLLNQGILPADFFSRAIECQFASSVLDDRFTVEVGCADNSFDTRYYAGGVFAPPDSNSGIDGILEKCRGNGVYLEDEKECWLNRIGSCLKDDIGVPVSGGSFKYPPVSRPCL